jgi:hypothetical protein
VDSDLIDMSGILQEWQEEANRYRSSSDASQVVCKEHFGLMHLDCFEYGHSQGVFRCSDLFLLRVISDIWIPIKGTKYDLTIKLIA